MLDFINGYADYANVLEAPRILHEIVAIQMLAAVLNRGGVSIPLGALRLSLDLWALVLSGSGAGRSTTVGLADPILKAARMQDMETSVVWGSAPSFYQHFAENPTGFYVWGEMSERLKLLNDRSFGGVKEWLTDRYDNLKTPPPYHYRRTGKEQDTPAIEFDQAPRINILATSSEDWFFRNLAQTDSAGGFLARWLIVRAKEEGRDVPVPLAPDGALLDPLAQRLRQLAELKGEADVSAVLGDYKDWYGSAKRRFESQPNPALARPYFNRHRGLVLKLAVVFEASLSGTLNVSQRAWLRAVELAGQVERCMFELLPTGMTATGFELKGIEERVRSAGAVGLSRNDLTRAFQSIKAPERDQYIQTLIDSGIIIAESFPTKGRTKIVYLHEDFLKQKAEPLSGSTVQTTWKN